MALGVDLLHVSTDYEIGRRIGGRVQMGADRAEYGANLLNELSEKLSAEYGNGFFVHESRIHAPLLTVASGQHRSDLASWTGISVYHSIMASYRVVLRQSEEGFSVSCPGLPGCWSQGATEAEALDNIQVAIREYIEGAEELASGALSRVVEVAIA